MYKRQQQQLRAVGIALDIRSYEFATFYSDVTRGAFQLYSLRWVGGSNQDPDVFENVFDLSLIHISTWCFHWRHKVIS